MTPPSPVLPSPAASPARVEDVSLERQRGAEVRLIRDILTGAAAGAVVGAGVWVLIVLIALAGSGWALGPVLAMGAGVGVFGGGFIGGWAGTMVGIRGLEEAEHANLHRSDESPPAGG